MAAIRAIYAHHVLTGTASFELEAPDEAEMASRFSNVVSKGFPFLVAESADGVVLGYAYGSAYRPRPAYAATVENSVYIHADSVGQGIGKALLTQLIEDCEALGLREMIAVIGDSANVASQRLHSSLGFTMVGTLRNVGFKFGKWLDTVLMQRPLGRRP